MLTSLVPAGAANDFIQSQSTYKLNDWNYFNTQNKILKIARSKTY